MIIVIYTVIFWHNMESRFPTASAYSIQLRLPISHGDKYPQIKDYFLFAVFGIHGFGGI